MITLLFNVILFLSFSTVSSFYTPFSKTTRAPTQWEVQASSTLGIEGQSNINKFRCDIESYDQPDTIICYNDASSAGPVKLKGSLKIDLVTFDCHSRLITNDMRKTLKAGEFPKLLIHFLSLERFPVFNGETDMIKGLVTIELAGMKKNFEILYSFARPGSSAITLNGFRTFNLSDFNLKPPRKLAGIVRIKDEFSVNFKLMLVPF